VAGMKSGWTCLVFSGEIIVRGEEKHAMALLPAQVHHTVR
jgi:hypothetical protein